MLLVVVVDGNDDSDSVDGDEESSCGNGVGVSINGGGHGGGVRWLWWWIMMVAMERVVSGGNSTGVGISKVTILNPLSSVVSLTIPFLSFSLSQTLQLPLSLSYLPPELTFCPFVSVLAV